MPIIKYLCLILIFYNRYLIKKQILISIINLLLLHLGIKKLRLELAAKHTSNSLTEDPILIEESY